MTEPSGEAGPAGEAADGGRAEQVTAEDLALSEADDSAGEAVAGQDEPEEEWWQDPGMPWKHKPGRADIACLSWIGVLGLWGLAMIPLRSWLMGLNPPLLVGLTGSRAAIAALGALVRVGDYIAWWWPMLAGLLMSVKFDWVYWWAGKLWGRGMIEIWAGQSKRAAKSYARAERWALRWGALGILLAYVPIPLPIMAVVFVLAGASGMSLKKFILLDAISSLIWQMGYFVLGYAIGSPAVYILQQYARIANYVAIGLLVVIVGGYIFRQGQKTRETAAAATDRQNAGNIA